MQVENQNDAKEVQPEEEDFEEIEKLQKVGINENAGGRTLSPWIKE